MAKKYPSPSGHREKLTPHVIIGLDGIIGEYPTRHAVGHALWVIRTAWVDRYPILMGCPDGVVAMQRNIDDTMTVLDVARIEEK